MTWQAVAGSLIGAVIVAVINGLYLTRRSKKQLMNESITKERAEFREKLRALAVAFVSAEEGAPKEDIRNEIILRLNPYDEVENKLVELMNRILAEPKDPELQNRFIYNVQCMLKYDWEKSKEEAGLNHKHGEWKRIAKEVYATVATSKEVEKLRLRLGANHELPSAPREFELPQKKEEE